MLLVLSGLTGFGDQFGFQYCDTSSTSERAETCSKSFFLEITGSNHLRVSDLQHYEKASVDKEECIF
jgi:hypothetical protein